MSEQYKEPQNSQTNIYNNNFRPYEERSRHLEFFAPGYKSSTKQPSQQFNNHEQPFTQQPKPHLQNEANQDNLPDNFSYYHLGPKKTPNERDHRKINSQTYYNKIPNVAVVPNATPKNHFVSFSTVGGFFNNQATTPSTHLENYKQFSKIRNNYNIQNPDPVSYDHGEGNRFVTTDFFPSSPSNPYSTTPTPRQYYTSTSERFEQNRQQQDEDFHPSVGTRIKPSGPGFHLLSGEGTTEPPKRYLVSQFTEKGFQFYDKTTARPPAKLGPTRGPVVGVDFDFNKFIESIRQEQITNLKSNPRPVEKTNSAVFSTKLNALPGAVAADFITRSTPRPFYNTKSYSVVGSTEQPATKLRNFNYETTTLDSEEYYYDDDEEYTPTTKSTTVRVKQTTQRPTTTSTTTTTTTTTTTKAPKGYEGFIKSIPKPNSTKLQPVVSTTESADHEDSDDDEYYYDDEDYTFHVPPTNKYMPMSETRAPRPTPSYNAQRVPPSRHTTSQPIYQYNQTPETTTEIPSILQFPKDIFHELTAGNNANRFLNNSTVRPYTVRTRLNLAADPGLETTIASNRLYTSTEAPTKTRLPTTTRAPVRFSSTSRPMTTQRPTTTTRKVYTIRPYRGQPKWKNPVAATPTKTIRTGDKKNLLDVDDKVTNR